MTYIAGVDIGNSTTEVCIGEVGGAQVHFLSSASCKTTGTKGTIANVHGIRAALKEAMGKIGMETEALSLIRLNEAGRLSEIQQWRRLQRRSLQILP